MDKKVLDSIKHVYLGILAYDVIGILILFIIKQSSFSMIGGLIAGSIISMITFFILVQNIVSYVNKDKRKAAISNMFGYTIRLALYASILIYAAITKNINIFTVAIGLLSTSMVIKFQNLVLPKIKRKEI